MSQNANSSQNTQVPGGGSLDAPIVMKRPMKDGSEETYTTTLRQMQEDEKASATGEEANTKKKRVNEWEYYGRTAP